MTYLGWEEGVAGKEAPPPPSSRPRGLPAERSGNGGGRRREGADWRRLGFSPEPPLEIYVCT